MTLQIVFCIAIFLYMIVMLAWNKYPMGVTALTSMALLILFKCIGPANALSSFGNANAVIIVGMFVVLDCARHPWLQQLQTLSVKSPAEALKQLIAALLYLRLS